MGVEIPIYIEFDEVYLFETEKYFYNRESGEIFFLGERIDRLLENYNFLDIVYSIYKGEINKINYKNLANSLKILLRKNIVNKLEKEDIIDKILTINLYNNYSNIHNIYLITRVSRVGFIHTYRYSTKIGKRIIFTRYLNYINWKLNPINYFKSNIVWKSPLIGKLPHWQKLVKNWVAKYLKENFPHYYEEFKRIDKKYREYIRMRGYSDMEVYQFFIHNILKLNLEDLILFPKIVMAELIYLDYVKEKGREIILIPLYKGPLRQGP